MHTYIHILSPPWQTTAASSVAPQETVLLYWHCRRLVSDPWQVTLLTKCGRLLSPSLKEPVVTAIAPDSKNMFALMT